MPGWIPPRDDLWRMEARLNNGQFARLAFGSAATAFMRLVAVSFPAIEAPNNEIEPPGELASLMGWYTLRDEEICPPNGDWELLEGTELIIPRRLQYVLEEPLRSDEGEFEHLTKEVMERARLELAWEEAERFFDAN